MVGPFIASTTLVTIAEIGDKTQLLSLLLAARYRKPWPIILAILVATTFNHALAAWLGHELGTNFNSEILQWVVSLTFIALGIWALVPDSLSDEIGEAAKQGSVFLISLVAFFLAEMGDKTQLATIALGAQYDDMFMVVIGTTLGMMIANVPAVFLGDKLLARVNLKYIRYTASAMFITFGLAGIMRLLMG